MAKIKIFLAEDDPLILGMYEKAFQNAGYDVETAFNGKTAFEKMTASEVKPTVILSDVMMPEMNGLELLKKIKADPALKNIPVVMLTNLGGDQDVQKALELGAVTYLVKSEYTPKEVLGKLKEIIAASSRKDIPEVKVAIKGRAKDERSV